MISRMTMRAASLLGTILALGIAATAVAQTTYDAVQAGEDAYQAAEAQRHAAIAQQRQLGSPVYGYGALPPSVYAAYPYGYVYNPRRAYRQGMRYGYPPLFQTWPRVPGSIDAYPHYGPMYGPGYGQPQVPTPASPMVRPQPLVPATDRQPSSLEPIPAPAGEPGS